MAPRRGCKHIEDEIVHAPGHGRDLQQKQRCLQRSRRPPSAGNRELLGSRTPYDTVDADRDAVGFFRGMVYVLEGTVQALAPRVATSMLRSTYLHDAG